MSSPCDAPTSATTTTEPYQAQLVECGNPFAPPSICDAVWRHGLLFAAAASILVASFVLRVQGEHAVCLPVVGTPLPELCYWRAVSGLPCPGCGLTRCFISMAHGELSRAWSFQPVGCLLFLGVVFQIPYRAWQIWRLRRGQGDQPPRWLVVAAWLFVPAFFVQWIGRLLV
ncbi:MAG: DUF2752 domain-containing protein [Pirellulales bacterium]|nr:DUF2752 domain-containing protein [Pirellulales bacterium]